MNCPEPNRLQRESNAHQVLNDVFKLDRFRDGQEAIIRDVLSGHDTLAVMPTGSGKSLCYQLPGFMIPGLTLIISPLIALMKDQIDSLLARGIPAAGLARAATRHHRCRRPCAHQIPIRRARAHEIVGLFVAHATRQNRALSRRRSPLHQPMGTRFSPRLPTNRRFAPIARKPHHHRTHRDCLDRCTKGYRRTAPFRRPPYAYPRIRPEKPPLWCDDLSNEK